MNKFKSKKIDFRGKNAYLYRDFIIINDMQFFENQQAWYVKYTNGKTIHSPKNKREGMEWVDKYYEEMNNYNNSGENNDMFN